MNLRDLVGKKVKRIAPIIYSNGIRDYSYTDVTERTPVCEKIIDDIPILSRADYKWSPDIRFDDDMWVDCSSAYEYMYGGK